MQLTLTIDREDDGRWIVEVPELHGVMVYGATRCEARGVVVRLASSPRIRTRVVEV